jgi:hypothetical protein
VAKRFNLDPALLGRTFPLNGGARTVVGVMPLRFVEMGVPLWLPIAFDRGDPGEAKQRYFMFQRASENQASRSVRHMWTWNYGALTGAANNCPKVHRPNRLTGGLAREPFAVRRSMALLRPAWASSHDYARPVL